MRGFLGGYCVFVSSGGLRVSWQTLFRAEQGSGFSEQALYRFTNDPRDRHTVLLGYASELIMLGGHADREAVGRLTPRFRRLHELPKSSFRTTLHHLDDDIATAIPRNLGVALTPQLTSIAAMRYVDTGSRDPAEALGTWLKSAIELNSKVQALRFQTGFFNAAPLILLKPTMARLAQADGILRLLIGSNDGCTSRADIEQLLAISGPPRKRRIGIVNFGNAYFHPKTIHIVRADASEAAYVGSSNLTAQGVNGLHVEAGIILDTHDGDDAAVLAKIRQAIDWWFSQARPGMHPIWKSSDLDALVKDDILDVPPPVLTPGVTSKKSKAPSTNLSRAASGASKVFRNHHLAARRVQAQLRRPFPA